MEVLYDYPQEFEGKKIELTIGFVYNEILAIQIANSLFALDHPLYRRLWCMDS